MPGPSSRPRPPPPRRRDGDVRRCPFRSARRAGQRSLRGARGDKTLSGAVAPLSSSEWGKPTSRASSSGERLAERKRPACSSHSSRTEPPGPTTPPRLSSRLSAGSSAVAAKRMPSLGKLDSIDPDDGSVSGLALGIASLAAADVERLGGGRERADRRRRRRGGWRQPAQPSTRGSAPDPRPRRASGHGPQRHHGRFRLRRR